MIGSLLHQALAAERAIDLLREACRACCTRPPTLVRALESLLRPAAQDRAACC